MAGGTVGQDIEHRSQNRVTAIGRNQSVYISPGNSLEGSSGEQAVPVADVDVLTEGRIGKYIQNGCQHRITSETGSKGVDITAGSRLETTRQKSGVSIADRNTVRPKQGRQYRQRSRNHRVTAVDRSQGVDISAGSGLKGTAQESTVALANLGRVQHRKDRIDNQGSSQNRIATRSRQQSICIISGCNLKGPRQENRIAITDLHRVIGETCWDHRQGRRNHRVATVYRAQGIDIITRNSLKSTSKKYTVSLANLRAVIYCKGWENGNNRCQETVTTIPGYQSIYITTRQSLESPACKYAVPVADRNRNRIKRKGQYDQSRCNNRITAPRRDQAVYITACRGLESTRQEDRVTCADVSRQICIDGRDYIQLSRDHRVTAILRTQGINIGARGGLESTAYQKAVPGTNLNCIIGRESWEYDQSGGHNRVTSVGSRQGIHIDPGGILESPTQKNTVPGANRSIGSHLNI